MKAKLAPVLAQRRAALEAAITHEQDLAQWAREQDSAIQQDQYNVAQLRIASCDELNALGSNADIDSMSARLRGVQDRLDLRIDARDMLHHVRIPAARIARLQAGLEVARTVEVDANIDHATARSEMLDKAISAGLFDSGKMGLFSEKVDALHAAKEKAARRVTDAENELRETRQKQEADRQTRSAHGLITRAEIAAAIPIYAGHAAQ
jgi:hypothetical protein